MNTGKTIASVITLIVVYVVTDLWVVVVILILAIFLRPKEVIYHDEIRSEQIIRYNLAETTLKCKDGIIKAGANEVLIENNGFGRCIVKDGRRRIELCPGEKKIYRAPEYEDRIGFLPEILLSTYKTTVSIEEKRITSVVK